jgi:type I restriction enzyme S subunit
MSNRTESKKLKDLFAFRNGRSFNKLEWSERGLPIIRIQNLNNSEAPFNYFRGKYGNDILVQSGDLLFSWSGTVGSSFGPHIWRRETGVLNQHIFKISLNPKIEKHYAYYALKQITEAIESQVNGAVGLVHITKEKLNEFEIPVPALPEQQRIVIALDKAFAAIATTKANTEKNLQNARALFESELQVIFTENRDGWSEKPLGALAEFRNGINYTQNSKGERIQVVGVKDFQKNFWVPSGDLDTVSVDDRLADLDLLKSADLLLVRSNGNPALIGRCMLANGLPKRISHSGFTIRVRLSGSELLPEYLCHFMKSATTRTRLVASGTGTNIKSLNQQSLSKLNIPYPSIRHQKALVKRVVSIADQTQRLESTYRQKLAALEALKKSLLHEAFRGQL